MTLIGMTMIFIFFISSITGTIFGLGLSYFLLIKKKGNLVKKIEKALNRFHVTSSKRIGILPSSDGQNDFINENHKKAAINLIENILLKD